MSLRCGLLEAALGEAPVALPPLQPERLLLPPHHGDDVEADGLPATTDQQGQLYGIFLQVFGAEVTWMWRVWPHRGRREVRRLPQPVPQAELGVHRNTCGLVPPHSSHPSPMLRFGCGSPANAISKPRWGRFREGDASLPGESGLGQRSGHSRHPRKPRAAEQGCTVWQQSRARKENVTYEILIRKGLGLQGQRKRKRGLG